MTNGNIVTNYGWIFISGNMYNTIILYIGIISNLDVKDITSKNMDQTKSMVREPISTSPIITEFGAIKQSEFIFGTLFLKGNNDTLVLMM